MNLNGCIVISAVLLATTACQRPASQPKRMHITTSSEKARSAYVKARDLADNLRINAAKPFIDEALREDPNFPLALLLRAEAASTSSEYFELLKTAAAAALKASDGEQMWISGSVALASGQMKEGGELFVKLTSTYPEDERARVLLSYYHAALGKHDDAVAECRKAVQLAPNYPPPYNVLGYSLQQSGDYRGAETALQKYAELIPNEPNPHDSLAYLLMSAGRFDDSIATFRKALSIDPAFQPSHTGIAANLLLQEKHDEAVAQLRKAFEISNTLSERQQVLRNIAICRADQGRFDAAVAELSNALVLAEQSGDRFEAAMNLRRKGFLLLHSDKPEAARVQFAMALEQTRNSNAPEPHKKQMELSHHGSLALVAAASRDFSTANREAALMRSGFEGWATTEQMRWPNEVLGIVALRQNNYDEAIARFLQADPASLHAKYYLGKAYAGKGNREKAVSCYRKITSTYAFPTLWDALVRKAAQRELGG